MPRHAAHQAGAEQNSRRVLAITLVVDQNPSPMAAKFELGPDAHVSEISTRVRVNNYTPDVHAVAELSDGKLYMTRLVKRPAVARRPPPRMPMKQKKTG